MMKQACFVLVAMLLVTQGLGQAERCEEYSYKTRDDQIDKPMDHTEVASISVGDHERLSDVIVTTKLLVKQFNGVKISLDVISPDSVHGQPSQAVELKNRLRHNPNFFMDHLKPLKLQVIWRDDAEDDLGDALNRMTNKQIRKAKQEFHTVVARPDVRLSEFARGISTNAGAGGSKGTWEFRVENSSFRRREHVKMLDWDLTLCFAEPEAAASEAASEVYQIADASEQPEDDVIFQTQFGGRLGSRLRNGLPSLVRRQRAEGGLLGRLRAAQATQGGLFGRLRSAQTSQGGGLFGRLRAAQASQDEAAGERVGFFARFRPQALLPMRTTRPGLRLFRIFQGDDENN